MNPLSIEEACLNTIAKKWRKTNKITTTKKTVHIVTVAEDGYTCVFDISITECSEI